VFSFLVFSPVFECTKIACPIAQLDRENSPFFFPYLFTSPFWAKAVAFSEVKIFKSLLFCKPLFWLSKRKCVSDGKKSTPGFCHQDHGPLPPTARRFRDLRTPSFVRCPNRVFGGNHALPFRPPSSFVILAVLTSAFVISSHGWMVVESTKPKLAAIFRGEPPAPCSRALRTPPVFLCPEFFVLAF